MTISVIIPVYNAEATIERAIESVLAQVSGVDEVIVVDDGSTDDTARIVKRYSVAVCYRFQKNRGVSAARNAGILESCCEWVAFLDADDEWLPNWVQRHRRVLERYPGCKWCCCDFQRSDELKQEKLLTHDEEVTLEDRIPYLKSCLRGVRFQTSGFLIHRSVFEEVGRFNPVLRIGEDTDLWARIAMRYPLIGYCSEVCYRHWQDNDGSLMKGNYPRDLVLSSLCRNVELAKSLGPGVLDEYYPYARRRAISYILRAAAGVVGIGSKALCQGKSTFPPSYGELGLEALVKILPDPVAARVVGLFVD